MIPDRKLTLRLEIDLIRSLEKSFQLEISREAARGFSTLHWIKADLSEFILGWTPAKPVAPEAVFSALLRRRILNRYGVSVTSSGESGWGSDSDWKAFEAAAAAWLDEQLLAPIDAAGSRTKARIGAEVKKQVDKRLTVLGSKISRVSRELSMVACDSRSLRVCSYFSAGRSGFSYWQDILLRDVSKASIRESYMSMFGISSQTELRNLSRSGVEEAATFVVEQATKLIDYVHRAS